MAVIGQWERKKVFITARTYPTPAKRGVEVSCTAGITDEGEWIRLFPIPYRFLSYDKRFSKNQWIEVEAAKDSDHRPESHQVNIDTIRPLSSVPTNNYWAERKKIVSPLEAHCLCCLQRQRNEFGHPTLGFYKPRQIRRLFIRKIDPNWSESDLAKLSQPTMFENAPFQLLEKIPYKFVYQVFCDEAACRGHHLSCTDWEMGQSYRKWLQTYGADRWEEKFRHRFEYEMIERFDTHLYVGTVSSHPAAWIIVGLFYPLREPV